MVVARKWIQTKAFEGAVSLDNFQLVEEELPALKAGEILIEALYLTVDPYMRVFPKQVDKSPIGQQIAKVVDSKNDKFPIGKIVLAMVGWRDKTVLDPDQDNPYYVTRFTPKKTLVEIPNVGDVPYSLYLGILGMPGLTAYFGFLEKCRPKPGDVVLVSAAAGAVGSVVGQIAKIKGCTVIGSAGNKEKIDWLKSIGFDYVFNYKETAVEDAIKTFAPNGIDCYFDNVGGEYALKVLDALSPYGRMCCCGQISRYNTTEAGPEKDVIHTIMINELSVSGIMVYSYTHAFPNALAEIAQWIKEGKLKPKETVFDGFTKLPDAFLEIFKGTASGKLVVKA
ncbi:unnamed protein product [Lymnaea stagnalis]|uniref:15-oxoprostaglandin 13-reductase n=1 Tax=Lymnaea stagnalis TaxID=6523 RepID=A0AAV2HQZ8_LYMST